MGSTSDPLVDRIGWSIEEVRLHWSWAFGSGFLNICDFSLTRRLARNESPLFALNYRACKADMPDCLRCSSGLEETAEHAFYYCERVCRSGITLEGGRPISNSSSIKRYLSRVKRSSLGKEVLPSLTPQSSI